VFNRLRDATFIMDPEGLLMVDPGEGCYIGPSWARAEQWLAAR
jgi:hypothetical protein